MSGYTTTKKQVKGKGGGKHGAGLWIAERLSSLILIPLTLWGVWAGVQIAAADGRQGAVEFLSVPLNAVLMIAVVVVSLWHMHMGMRVIVEDYLHKAFGKGAALFVNFVVCAGLGLAAVFSILMVAFGRDLGV